MELFNWQQFGNDIHIGTYNAKMEANELRRRTSGKYTNDKERNRQAYKAKREAMGKQVNNYAR